MLVSTPYNINDRLKKGYIIKTLSIILLVWFGFFIAPIAKAAVFKNCYQTFYALKAPKITEINKQQKTVPLCFDGFAVLYSGKTRTPLWSAEYLTRERLYRADDLEREDNFHEESRLPFAIRATVYDYSGIGYDRGHLAPNADMANKTEQYESFSLANIAPQSPYLNREVWRKIESSTRYLTKVHGQAYVVTGVVFEDKNAYQWGQAVVIPSHFFKVVYFPKLNQAGVYYAPNDESGRIEVISINELITKHGISPMPALQPAVMAKAMQLPLPNQNSINPQTRGQNRDQPEFNTGEWWMQLFAKLWQWISAQLYSK
ncbi:MAG: endonuclease [Gammaproteobacteria bacterium]|nr:MAG: endonuclease [Gammaproteobacteria bacterium]